MKFLITEIIPCWYELSWQERKPALILRVHKDFITNLKPIREEWSFIQSLKEEFQFRNFISDFGGNFGFENALQRKEKNDWIEFVGMIPKVEITKGNCKKCGGSGKDEERWDGDCLYCHGSGKNFVYDWHSVYALSASLSIFFWVASRPPEKDTSASFPQLMVIETVIRKGDYGGSLSGEISISLRKWLSSFGDHSKIPEMVQAMRTADAQMFISSRSHEYYFRVSIEGGGFSVSCPGNACGIYTTSHGYIKEGEGCSFSSHNVDTPMQQITLLTVLAALHDRARREIKF